MSKKKSVKSELKHDLKRKTRRRNAKGVNKREGKKIKRFELSRAKNKQNIIKGNVCNLEPKLSVRKSTTFKRTNNKLVNAKRKSNKDEKIVNKSSGATKGGNLVRKLNKQKINAMLNANESQISFKDKKKFRNLSLRDRMLYHLKSSRFRFLNEQMYNSTSLESKEYFENDTHAFHAYHEGYEQQVARWPINPLNTIIESIMKMPKNYIIADFGCGEAKLANSVPHMVHSFDLIAMNDKVKACDMAHTPLLTGHTNVVVFCLSLMGSNLKDYLVEANRVLEKNGIIKIAEIASRFNQVDGFISSMYNYGFINTWKNLSNDLFYFLDFKKTRDILKKDVDALPKITLKSCLYKKR